VCAWWRCVGDCGGLEKEGGEGERCPKRSGGGSTLAVEAETLIMGCYSYSVRAYMAGLGLANDGGEERWVLETKRN
jgi:hypothetical protein